VFPHVDDVVVVDVVADVGTRQFDEHSRAVSERVR